MFRYFRRSRLYLIANSRSYSNPNPNDRNNPLKNYTINCLSLASFSYGCYKLYETVDNSTPPKTLDDFPLVEFDENVFDNPKDYLRKQMPLEGHFDNQNIVYIGPRPNYNRNTVSKKLGAFETHGFNVFTPFVLNDGRRVLVNRGWVSPKCKQNPIRIEMGQIEGPTRIVGFLVDEESNNLATEVESSFNFSKLWIYSQDFVKLDLELLSRRLNLSLKEAYFVARAQPSSNRDAPIGDQYYFGNPQKSSGYIKAVIYWGLAVALLQFK